MTGTIALRRLAPWAFLGRLGVAAVELVMAAVILSGSVVVGHALKDWRAWYWDPATTHPWAPTVAPSATPVPTAAAAVTPAVHVVQLSLPTPAPACRPSSGEQMLALVDPVGQGADCVWLAYRSDGTHLIVGASGSAPTDLGIVGSPQGGASVRTFDPNGSPSRVIVVMTDARLGPGPVLVFTLRDRHPVILLRTIGTVRIEMDAAGWPRLTVSGGDGTKTYFWDGGRYTAG